MICTDAAPSGTRAPVGGRTLPAVVGLLLAATVAAAALPTLMRPDRATYDWASSWGSSGSGSGQFSGPIGVAVDDSGYVYVSDAGNDRIQKFTRDGGFVTAWGQSGTDRGQLRRPMHMEIEGDSVLHVSEYLNDRVQAFFLDGSVAGVVEEGSEASGGELDAPGGAAARSDGEEIWIADFFHHRVAVFGRADGYRRQVGTRGRWLPGRLHYPTDIAFGPDGSAYVADAYNHRVQRYAANGERLDTWGGPFGLGIPGPWKGWFSVATGVHADSEGRVFVADFYNHRIQVFDASGAFLAEWGGSGDGDGRFDRPTDVATAADGTVYVVDFGNDRIQMFRCTSCEGR